MIYTEKTKQAMILAFTAHEKQVDKSGIPYIYHPIYVAERMEDEETTIVALLHDVIEDTNITLSDLKKIGFDFNVIEALTLLTHKNEISYYDYVKNISRNKIATKVKMADLEHNMKLERLNKITDKDLERVKKYKECYSYLKNVLDEDKYCTKKFGK